MHVDEGPADTLIPKGRQAHRASVDVDSTWHARHCRALIGQYRGSDSDATGVRTYWLLKPEDTLAHLENILRARVDQNGLASPAPGVPLVIRSDG